MNISIAQAKPLVMDALKANLAIMLKSSPGLGKSSLAKEIADEHELELIDIRLSQMDPTDMSGLPMKQGDRAVYLPISNFPLEGDPLPKGKNGWLLLLDEINSAPLAVQAAAYRLILDRELGTKPLHKRVAVMAAGNLTTDKAITNRLSTAMQSRMIHLTLEADVQAWMNWANKNDIDHRIKSFIEFKPDLLHKFDPNHNDETYPCPRTWEFMSKLTKPHAELSEDRIALYAGTIGEGPAREFFTYTKIFGQIAKIEDILKNPDGIKVPEETGTQFAYTGMIAHYMNEQNAEPLMRFLKRFTIDFQVICLRSLLTSKVNMREHAVIREWIRENAKEMSTFS
jgi:hypothetical protein